MKVTSESVSALNCSMVIKLFCQENITRECLITYVGVAASRREDGLTKLT